MKLHLLHGPAIASSRKKLVDIKEKFNINNVVVFDERSDVQTILGSLMTPSLLPEEQLIVLENPPEDFNDYTLYPIPYVSEGKESFAYTLVLWFDHEVSEKKPIMEWAKINGQILYFPEAKEVSVFPFLDYLAAHEKIAFIEMDKLKKAGFDIHYLITMVFYLLRSLVVTPKAAPDFVRKKIIKQRARFNLEDIESFYNATRYKTRSDIIASYYKDILEIDFKIKSGLLDEKQAEFSLVNLFCHQI